MSIYSAGVSSTSSGTSSEANSGTSSSAKSGTFNPSLAAKESAIFFKLARASGPSWLMIPGKSSCNSVVQNFK